MFHSIREALERREHYRLLGLLATLYSSLRLRGRYHIFFDEGVWVHRYRGHSSVLTDLTIPSRAEADYLRRVASPPAVPNPASWILGAGEVAIVIGAGIETMAWSLSNVVGRKGKIVAVEADPRRYLCLKKTCGYNRLGNVETENCVITDKNSQSCQEGETRSHVPSILWDGNTPVQSLTLDELAARHGLNQVNFLYMNIGGAERRAILGMESTIREVSHACIACHDVFTERHHGEHMQTKSLIVKYLQDRGFEVFRSQGEQYSAAEDYVLACNRALDKRPLVELNRLQPYAWFPYAWFNQLHAESATIPLTARE